MTITFGGKDRQPARILRDGHRRRRCQATRRRTRSTQRGHRMRIPAPLRIRSDSAAVLSGRSRGVPGPVWEEKDSLILQGRAPSPARPAKLTRSQVVSALRSARRHLGEDKADALLTLLRRSSLQQPSTVAAAFTAIVSSQTVVISALNTQIEQLQVVVAENFDQHPAVEIYLGQPGLGQVLAAPVLGEFGATPAGSAAPSPARASPGRARSPEPDHPSIGQEDRRPGPLRREQQTRRRASRPCRR
jgi:hypothetical protein